MKVLHVVAADRWTGAAAPALAAVLALRGAGVDATFLCRGGDTLAAHVADRSWAFPVLAKERSVSDLRAAVREVRRRAETTTVVHVHLPHDHLLARLALRGLPARLVRSVRAPRHLRPDPFHRWLFRGTDGVAWATSALAEQGARRTMVRRLAEVTLPPLAEERFFRAGAARDTVRAGLGIPAGAVVAGTVGKLHPGRGQIGLLRALARVPGVVGLVVGDGDGRPVVEAEAHALGVADRVVFAGYVGPGLEELVAAMDVYVFPAAGSDWGHRAAADAAAAGVPVIAADVLGIRDVVEPGCTGDLFTVGDAERLAELLGRWSEDAGRRDAAGAAARRRAEAFAPAATASALMGLYARLAET